MKVVLASSSPRRNELMKWLDITYEVIVKETNEDIGNNVNPYDKCMEIAKRKAMNVFNDINDDVIVIGSDTMVIYKDKIYGKPINYNDAFNMLKEFSGNKHEVISSLCLLIRKNGVTYEELTYDQCNVYVDKISDEEINNWIINHDVYTRAGAYAIQDGFGKYIKKVEGDYFSIVGFPIHKLYNLLKKYL